MDDEKIDLRHLTKEETDKILEVIKKDDQLRESDQKIFDEIKVAIKDLKVHPERPEVKQHKLCERCNKTFKVDKHSFCQRCHQKACKNCRISQDRGGQRWICILCIKQRRLEEMSGHWVLKYQKRKYVSDTDSGAEPEHVGELQMSPVKKRLYDGIHGLSPSEEIKQLLLRSSRMKKQPKLEPAPKRTLKDVIMRRNEEEKNKSPDEDESDKKVQFKRKHSKSKHKQIEQTSVAHDQGSTESNNKDDTLDVEGKYGKSTHGRRRKSRDRKDKISKSSDKESIKKDKIPTSREQDSVKKDKIPTSSNKENKKKDEISKSNNKENFANYPDHDSLVKYNEEKDVYPEKSKERGRDKQKKTRGHKVKEQLSQETVDTEQHPQEMTVQKPRQKDNTETPIVTQVILMQEDNTEYKETGYSEMSLKRQDSFRHLKRKKSMEKHKSIDVQTDQNQEDNERSTSANRKVLKVKRRHSKSRERKNVSTIEIPIDKGQLIQPEKDVTENKKENENILIIQDDNAGNDNDLWQKSTSSEEKIEEKQEPPKPSLHKLVARRSKQSLKASYSHDESTKNRLLSFFDASSSGDDFLDSTEMRKDSRSKYKNGNKSSLKTRKEYYYRSSDFTQPEDYRFQENRLQPLNSSEVAFRDIRSSMNQTFVDRKLSNNNHLTTNSTDIDVEITKQESEISHNLSLESKKHDGESTKADDNTKTSSLSQDKENQNLDLVKGESEQYKTSEQETEVLIKAIGDNDEKTEKSTNSDQQKPLVQSPFYKDEDIPLKISSCHEIQVKESFTDNVKSKSPDVRPKIRESEHKTSSPIIQVTQNSKVIRTYNSDSYDSDIFESSGEEISWSFGAKKVQHRNTQIEEKTTNIINQSTTLDLLTLIPDSKQETDTIDLPQNNQSNESSNSLESKEQIENTTTTVEITKVTVLNNNKEENENNSISTEKLKDISADNTGTENTNFESENKDKEASLIKRTEVTKFTKILQEAFSEIEGKETKTSPLQQRTESPVSKIFQPGYKIDLDPEWYPSEGKEDNADKNVYKNYPVFPGQRIYNSEDYSIKYSNEVQITRSVQLKSVSDKSNDSTSKIIPSSPSKQLQNMESTKVGTEDLNVKMSDKSVRELDKERSGGEIKENETNTIHTSESFQCSETHTDSLGNRQQETEIVVLKEETEENTFNKTDEICETEQKEMDKTNPETEQISEICVEDETNDKELNKADLKLNKADLREAIEKANSYPEVEEKETRLTDSDKEVHEKSRSMDGSQKLENSGESNSSLIIISISDSSDKHEEQTSQKQTAPKEENKPAQKNKGKNQGINVVVIQDKKQETAQEINVVVIQNKTEKTSSELDVATKQKTPQKQKYKKPNVKAIKNAFVASRQWFKSAVKRDKDLSSIPETKTVDQKETSQKVKSITKYIYKEKSSDEAKTLPRKMESGTDKDGEVKEKDSGHHVVGEYNVVAEVYNVDDFSESTKVRAGLINGDNTKDGSERLSTSSGLGHDSFERASLELKSSTEIEQINPSCPVHSNGVTLAPETVEDYLIIRTPNTERKAETPQVGGLRSGEEGHTKDVQNNNVVNNTRIMSNGSQGKLDKFTSFYDEQLDDFNGEYEYTSSMDASIHQSYIESYYGD